MLNEGGSEVAKPLPSRRKEKGKNPEKHKTPKAIYSLHVGPVGPAVRANVVEKGGLAHYLRPPESPLRRTQNPIDRVLNPGFLKPRVLFYFPADSFAEEKVDGGFFPSAGALWLGFRVAEALMIPAEVAVPCAVLHEFAQQGPGQL